LGDCPPETWQPDFAQEVVTPLDARVENEGAGSLQVVAELTEVDEEFNNNPKIALDLSSSSLDFVVQWNKNKIKNIELFFILLSFSLGQFILMFFFAFSLSLFLSLIFIQKYESSLWKNLAK
jgi:ABC-type proline/glycine betaine transport system permease subunit